MASSVLSHPSRSPSPHIASVTRNEAKASSLSSTGPSRKRKIAVLGYRGVGKSSTIIRFVDDHFADMYHPTIESTFRKSVKWRGIEYQVDIVDTAGMDEHSIFLSQYTLGVHGYVLVYSVASRSSFEQIEILNDKILHACGSDAVPRILVGAKCDLRLERQVTIEQGRELAQKLGCLFLECSAKHNENIDTVFLKLLESIDKLQQPAEEPEDNCIIL